MKTLRLLMLFLGLALISCNENETIENADFSVASIKAIVTEMQNLANAENKIVYASITLDKNNRFMANHIQTLSASEKGFIEGFSGKKMKESITVSCSGGTDTHCEGRGLSLYRCIGSAIKDCLDGGGCAEVCSAEMTVAPE